MRNTVSVQLASGNSRPSKQRKLITSIALWSLQVLVALPFLFAGGIKLILPIALLQAQMPMPLPGLFIRSIATAEVAGALGLILPGLLRIRPMLTPLAAGCIFREVRRAQSRPQLQRRRWQRARRG